MKIELLVSAAPTKKLANGNTRAPPRRNLQFCRHAATSLCLQRLPAFRLRDGKFLCRHAKLTPDFCDGPLRQRNFYRNAETPCGDRICENVTAWRQKFRTAPKDKY